MSNERDPRVLIIPTHPGVQYHFCRSDLPIYFFGHWDQFKYWRPQPSNVHNVFESFDDAQLDYGPQEYAELLDDERIGWPANAANERYDIAWLMFNWQYKLFRERPAGKKLYRVSKVAELEPTEWDEILARDDFRVVSFYPNTVAWLKDVKGVDVPYVPLGLDSKAYGGWTGEDPLALSIIHSYRDRGWHYNAYQEAMSDVPHLHVDHLDPDQEKYSYDDLQRLLKRARLYLHDGEQEYTITLIEAMMTGMPLVSFRLPGIERYVVHGKNGFVGDTAAQIREHCRALIADRNLADQMGCESRRMALAEYDETRWRNDWQRILRAYAR